MDGDGINNEVYRGGAGRAVWLFGCLAVWLTNFSVE